MKAFCESTSAPPQTALEQKVQNLEIEGDYEYPPEWTNFTGEIWTQDYQS